MLFGRNIKTKTKSPQPPTRLFLLTLWSVPRSLFFTQHAAVRIHTVSQLTPICHDYCFHQERSCLRKLSLCIQTLSSLRYSKLNSSLSPREESPSPFSHPFPPYTYLVRSYCPLVSSTSQKKQMPAQMYMKSLPQAFLSPCRASGQDPT